MENKEAYILSKIAESDTKRHRIVTTDVGMFKAVRNLARKGLVQYRFVTQPAQPMGLIAHGDRLNKASDWAEKMVCQIVDAKQTPRAEKGHDGVLKDGTKIEVKMSGLHKGGNGDAECKFGGVESPNEFDYLIFMYWDMFDCVDLVKAKFMVLPKDIVDKHKTKHNQVRFNPKLTSERYRKLLPFSATLAELVELKHGYEHFLKMKGKVKPIEPPKEFIQLVIDIWEPNKFNLMPFDFRYESDDWYAEFVVSQLLRGKMTEERNEGFDVLLEDGLKVQVKLANISPRSDGNRKDVCLNSIKKDSDYDLLIGLFWDDITKKESNDLDSCKTLIIPKDVADLLIIPYNKNNPEKGCFYFTLNSNGKYRKDAAIHKYEPFFFTIDHLAELGQIGYPAFYDKYLKEICQEVLGKEEKEEVIEKEMTESYTPSYPALPFPGWSSAMVPSNLNVYQPSSFPS